MNCLKSLVLGSLLLAGTVNAQIGFNIGPFSLQFDTGETYYDNGYREVLDNPLCQAITQQNRVEMIVESREKVNAKEIKIVQKKIVIEPYAFGVTKQGKPILRGNVIEDKLVKEVTVKYGEDMFEDTTITNDQKKKGYFSGLFSTSKSQDLDIRRVSNLHIIPNSRFDLPKKYEGIKDDNIKVICQIPVPRS